MTPPVTAKLTWVAESKVISTVKWPSGVSGIDDTVLRRLQAALDSEEVRLSGGATVE